MIKRFIINWIHRNAFEIRRAMAIPTLPKNPAHFDEFVKNVAEQRERVQKSFSAARRVMRGFSVIVVMAALFYGCQVARAAQPPVCAMIPPMFFALTWSNLVSDPCFPFGKDAKGRPILPISHNRDGTLKTGDATAYGE